MSKEKRKEKRDEEKLSEKKEKIFDDERTRKGEKMKDLMDQRLKQRENGMAQLEVILVEGKNLKKKDKFSENDPFVKIYLDEKYPKQKSRTKENSKTPIWNESFVFNHFYGQDILYVDIYDEDSLKDQKIGSIKIDLQPLYKTGHLDQWFNIPDRNGQNSNGEIHLILRYDKLIV